MEEKTSQAKFYTKFIIYKTDVLYTMCIMCPERKHKLTTIKKLNILTNMTEIYNYFASLRQKVNTI